MRGLRFGGFVVRYAWELLLANLAVARQALSPRLSMRPAILAVQLANLSDAELLVLTNLISMTPGSLSLDVSSDRRFLYVHVMDAVDLDEARSKLERDLQRPLQEVFRS